MSGAYSFGYGATDKLELKVTRGKPMLGRIEGTKCNLFHLGSYTFYPAGAPDVRIRFTVADGKARLCENGETRSQMR